MVFSREILEGAKLYPAPWAFLGVIPSAWGAGPLSPAPLHLVASSLWFTDSSAL